ncbi:ATP-binding protein [Belliella pelovolcani]
MYLQNKMLLMEIIVDRQVKKSTIITFQIPVSAWYEIIEDQTFVDANLDRIVHVALRIVLKGESLRSKRNINQVKQEIMAKSVKVGLTNFEVKFLPRNSPCDLEEIVQRI